MAVIFVLIDGVGLAPDGPHNPVPGGFNLLAGLLDMPLDDALHVDRDSVYAAPIDATLGVAGLPQSGSGHTALFGGFNAAHFNGRHQPSYPTIAMRERLAEHNLLSAAVRQGRRVAWANAYLPGYSQAVAGRRLRHTAGTWSALQAGLGLRGLPELQQGMALSWDVTQAMARTRPDCETLPLLSPQDAAERLLGLADTHDLVAFETYLPDLAGHARIPWNPPQVITILDGFLTTVAEGTDGRHTLIVTSDHGNVEDATTRIHTRNPVPLLAFGPDAAAFASVTSIDGVMDAILGSLER